MSDHYCCKRCGQRYKDCMCGLKVPSLPHQPAPDLIKQGALGANARQVGGRHYKISGEQHWDRQYRLYGPGYFIGCITKYVERYRDKNGIEDLEKAKHFIEKLIELEGMQPKKG